MWYNRLSEYLLKEGYQNNPICPYIFLKKSQSGFDTKNLRKTKFCVGLQIEHLIDEIFVHHSTYTGKFFKRFYLDKVHPLNTPMQIHSLDVKNDIFRPRDDNEELIGPEISYHSAIGTLIYLANKTRPDIAFSVNL